MVLIEPEREGEVIISTTQILSTIDKHADTTALILLPGIQYYTGQYLDIKTITTHAHALGLLIGWDCAHAVGNIELELHQWDVDFAIWCNYKYVNAGPGAIAGLFVHSRHGAVDLSAIKEGQYGFRDRLCGWWGGDKAIRFEMGNRMILNCFTLIYVIISPVANILGHLGFAPMAGAAGFQLGNPSALALTAVTASLEIFGLTSMSVIRTKSLALTKYLEDLLLHPPFNENVKPENLSFEIITPSSAADRGAQLSIRLKSGLLERVLAVLEDAGVVVDERKPDVIRVAPAPLYNTFQDVWAFANIFHVACAEAQDGQVSSNAKPMALGGRDEKGWAQIM